MLDGYNNKAGAVALTPGAKITASANGNAIDLSAFNNGANKLMFIMFAGQITDGTYVFKLQDSPDNSTWTDVVAAKYQQGPSVASFTSATPAGTVCKLGYLGNDSGASRYVRAVVTVTGATTGGFITGVAVLEGLGYLP
jgi:hypothetical protein